MNLEQWLRKKRAGEQSLSTQVSGDEKELDRPQTEATALTGQEHLVVGDSCGSCTFSLYLGGHDLTSQADH